MTVTTTASIDIAQLSGMKRKQLQSLCKKHGIKANAKTEKLIERLVEYAKNGGNGLESAETEVEDQSDKDMEENEYENEEDEVEEDGNVDSVGGPKDDSQASVADNVADSQMDDPNSLITNPGNKNAQADPESACVERHVQMLDAEPAEPCAAKPPLTVSEQIAAEMQARVAALAAEERKVIVDKYNSEKGTVSATPGKDKTELMSPKSVAFDRMHSKLFDQYDSIANHWAAKKSSGAATPKGKRAITEDLARKSNKRARVEPLFDSQTPKIDNTADLAGDLTISDKETTAAVQKQGANEPALEESLPIKQDTIATSVTDDDDDDSLNSSGLKTGDVLETEKISQPVNPEPVTKGQMERSAASLDPKAASEQTSAIPRPFSSSSSSFSSSLSSGTLATADKKPSKALVKTSTIDTKRTGIVASTTTKSGYRNVESKIKSYIHTKPPSPKIKPVKHTVVDSKKIPKPTVASKPAVAPAKSKHVVEKGTDSSADGEKRVPNYMKPTRAAENRANKLFAVAPAKGSNENKGGKDRNKPYSRPEKDSTAAAAVVATEKPADSKLQTKEAADSENSATTTN
ncbi:hypothetical protein FB639_003027 [Coemansia asiatica]|nr:hypothetical protein FB639_003027 [Coemansia asiatica]